MGNHLFSGYVIIKALPAPRGTRRISQPSVECARRNVTPGTYFIRPWSSFVQFLPISTPLISGFHLLPVPQVFLKCLRDIAQPGMTLVFLFVPAPTYYMSAWVLRGELVNYWMHRGIYLSSHHVWVLIFNCLRLWQPLVLLAERAYFICLDISLSQDKTMTIFSVI